MLDCCDNFVPKVLEQLRLDYAPLCGVVGQEFEVIEVIRSYFSEIFCWRSKYSVVALPRCSVLTLSVDTTFLPHPGNSVVTPFYVLCSNSVTDTPFSPMLW